MELSLVRSLDPGSSVLTDVKVQVLSSALQENRGFGSLLWKLLLFCACPDDPFTTVVKLSHSIGTINELTTTLSTETNFSLATIQKGTCTVRIARLVSSAELSCRTIV